MSAPCECKCVANSTKHARGSACGKRVRNEMRTRHAHRMEGQTKRQTQAATSEELLARYDRTSELRRILCIQIHFRTNINDGVEQQILEPTWKNKQPLSAVQPVFAECPWRKERLTHSQPREKPRHRKDTHSTVDAAQHRHREL